MLHFGMQALNGSRYSFLGSVVILNQGVVLNDVNESFISFDSLAIALAAFMLSLLYTIEEIGVFPAFSVL